MKNDILQPVPVDKLALGDDLRKAMGTVAEQHELRQSIKAHGLLNPLTVKPDGREGHYIIVAGARRYRALKDLIKAGEHESPEIPCVLYHDPENAVEAAIAENTARADMHPMDECDAFARLLDAGLNEEVVADRFGVGVDRVKRRLKLASLAPEVKDAYRKGEIHLSHAQAFTLTNDHERQVKVLGHWREADDWSKQAHYVHNWITENVMDGSSPRARYVGRKAYEKADGTVLEDLFSHPDDDETFWIEDAGLMSRLANEKLHRKAKTFKKQATWVEPMFDFDWQRFRECEEVEEGTEGAGVVLSLGFDGKVQVRWLLAPKPETEEGGEDGAEAAAGAPPPLDVEDEGLAGQAEPEKKRNKFSEALRADLCTLRGKTIAHRLSDRLATQVLIFELAKLYFDKGRWGETRTLGVGVDPHGDRHDLTADEEKRRSKLRLEWLDVSAQGATKPVAQFEAFMDLSTREQNAILAEVSRLLVKPSFTDKKRSNILEVLVRGDDGRKIPEINLTGAVRPDAEFWKRLSKSVAIEVATPYLGDDWLREKSKLKKKDFCTELEIAFKDRDDFVMPGFKPGAPDVNAQL